MGYWTEYLPPMTTVEKINHCLLSFGTGYHAEPYPGEEALVRVFDCHGASEAYNAEQLFAALEPCAGSDEVVDILMGELAL